MVFSFPVERVSTGAQVACTSLCVPKTVSSSTLLRGQTELHRCAQMDIFCRCRCLRFASLQVFSLMVTKRKRAESRDKWWRVANLNTDLIQQQLIVNSTEWSESTFPGTRFPSTSLPFVSSLLSSAAEKVLLFCYLQRTSETCLRSALT